MEVRHATVDDLPQIFDIYNSTIPGRTATADTSPVSVETRRGWFQDRDERHPVWVAESKESGESEESEKSGGISGWLSLGEFNTRPAYHATSEIAVYVAEDSQGSGVGRLLLKEAVRRAPALGTRTLIAGIFAHNEKSLGLFESFRFTRWGHLPRVAELDGAELDLVYLGLRLTD